MTSHTAGLMIAVMLVAGCGGTTVDTGACGTKGNCGNGSAGKSSVDKAGGVSTGGASPGDARLPAGQAWACVGAPPPAPSDGRASYTGTLHLVDLLGDKPVSGVVGKLCRQTDLECTTPVGEARESDQAGVIILEVPRAFSGYALLTSDSVMPGLFFIPRPVVSMFDVRVQMITPPIANALSNAVGTRLMPERGLALVSAFDCTASPAAGLVFEGADPEAVVFYSNKGIPTSQGTATDEGGYGGLMNLPPGPASIDGTIGDTRAKVGSVSFLSRAGSASYVSLLPNGS